MDQGAVQKHDLLSVGARYARDTHASCTDVAAFIFPAAINPPTDALINAVASKLVQIVSDLERRLAGSGVDPAQQPKTWPLLARSGFLREADLVDFVLARVAEDRLEARLDTPNPPLPNNLLDHADGHVAEAAQMLLAADSLHRHVHGSTYLALPAELLHKICWRVVAALEIFEGKRSADIIATAKAIIAGYEEAQTSQAAARKIVHFLGLSEQATMLKAQEAGLHLYVAAISAALDIDHDHVLRLMDANSSAPFAVLLSALGAPKEHAIDAIVTLRGDALSTWEAGLLDNDYGLMTQENALAEIGKWAVDRAQFLAFGQS